MINHVDRFYAAVSVLAGDGHIKQRLIRAYQDNLADIEAEELPIRLKECFIDLRKRMQHVTPLNGEGQTRASVRKMSCGEASACAVSMVSLYGEVIREADNRQDTLPLSGEDAHVVPPFLVKSAS